MINTNPFAELSASIDPVILQTYIIVMVVLVVGGTIFDMVHKKSAQYFFAKMETDKAKAKREVGGGEKISLAIQTALIEGATSSEFCNPMRRIAHLLGMYGFVLYVATTAIMVFGFPTPATPTPEILPTL